ncbi:unnamed protein product, partial [Hapterophycus canaliculatus]
KGEVWRASSSPRSVQNWRPARDPGRRDDDCVRRTIGYGRRESRGTATAGGRRLSRTARPCVNVDPLPVNRQVLASLVVYPRLRRFGGYVLRESTGLGVALRSLVLKGEMNSAVI